MADSETSWEQLPEAQAAPTRRRTFSEATAGATSAPSAVPIPPPPPLYQFGQSSHSTAGEQDRDAQTVSGGRVGECRSDQNFLSKMLDLRGILHLPTFSGRDEDFRSFRDELMNVIAPMGLDELAEAAAKFPQPLVPSLMTPEQRDKSKLMYVLLHSALQHAGRATAILKQVQDRNGFWAWQAINAEYKQSHRIFWLLCMMGCFILDGQMKNGCRNG